MERDLLEKSLRGKTNFGLGDYELGPGYTVERDLVNPGRTVERDLLEKSIRSGINLGNDDSASSESSALHFPEKTKAKPNNSSHKNPVRSICNHNNKYIEQTSPKRPDSRPDSSQQNVGGERRKNGSKGGREKNNFEITPPNSDSKIGLDVELFLAGLSAHCGGSENGEENGRNGELAAVLEQSCGRNDEPAAALEQSSKRNHDSIESYEPSSRHNLAAAGCKTNGLKSGDGLTDVKH